MRRTIVGAALGAAVTAVGLGAPASAHAQEFEALLRGFQEVPPVSTPATGSFDATVRPGLIEYELTYNNLQGEVSQAHIHFGQPGVNGGISVFLCSNADDAPAGVQTCPDSGTVTGTIQPADVIGPEAQGIAGGQFGRLAAAMRSGITYVNVHTDLFPGGEIRGQVRRVQIQGPPPVQPPPPPPEEPPPEEPPPVQPPPPAPPEEPPPVEPPPPLPPPEKPPDDGGGPPFTCGSKQFCGEMTSCAEARFYLTQCGLTRLDGDDDGIPCESLCR